MSDGIFTFCPIACTYTYFLSSQDVEETILVKVRISSRSKLHELSVVHTPLLFPNLNSAYPFIELLKEVKALCLQLKISNCPIDNWYYILFDE